MTRPMSVEAKVCGLVRPEDAAVAAGAGAAYLGVILAPGGKRTVTASAARAIFAELPVQRVGVFVNASADDLMSVARSIGLHVLQLHGEEPPELAASLRDAGFTVWKALRPRSGAEFAAEAARYAGSADAILLDGFSADARGGTGARFPWEEVAAHRDALPAGIRLIAAGGLNPSNVAEAARILRPDVVDVSSGVESAPGVKDHDAVRAFIAAARGESASGEG